MLLKNLMEKTEFEVINKGNTDIEISKPFCCDLLSIAMGKAPAGAVWVTVMGNVNTIAVASLAEVACVIFAEGVKPDDVAIEKAKTENITLLASKEPIFETATKITEYI